MDALPANGGNKMVFYHVACLLGAIEVYSLNRSGRSIAANRMGDPSNRVIVIAGSVNKLRKDKVPT